MKRQNYRSGVVLLEADSNYTILHKSDGSREISAYHLAWHIERFEKDAPILRPNRKYCVNLQFLKAINDDFLMMNHFQRQIPVSRRRKEHVESQLEKYLNQ